MLAALLCSELVQKSVQASPPAMNRSGEKSVILPCIVLTSDAQLSTPTLLR